MGFINRILIPVDFSERTRPALEYGVELAKMSGARLDVLHVWEPPRFVSPNVKIQVPGETRESLRTHISAQAEATMVQLLSELDVPAEIEVTPIVKAGRPAGTILELCEGGDYDLVICATSGRRGLAHFLVGSVAENVARNASCPVLILPAASED